MGVEELKENGVLCLVAGLSDGFDHVRAVFR